MSATRKQGSTLEPVVLDVTIPTLVPIEAEAIDSVVLLVSRRGRTSTAAIVDAEIPSEDWSLDGDVLTLTWYPEDGDLSPGNYEAEVWIYADERVLKTPSSGRALIEVVPSLVRQPVP